MSRTQQPNPSGFCGRSAAAVSESSSAHPEHPFSVAPVEASSRSTSDRADHPCPVASSTRSPSGSGSIAQAGDPCNCPSNVPHAARADAIGRARVERERQKAGPKRDLFVHDDGRSFNDGEVDAFFADRLGGE